MMNFPVPEATTYPVDAFPKVAREAILEMQCNVKAPLSLIATSFLSAMSVTAQAQVKIRLSIGGQPRPVSLYTIIIAESGERKTAVDNIVSKPLHAFDEASEKKHVDAVLRYETEFHRWKAVRDTLTRRFAKATCDDQPTFEFERRLTEHFKSEPIKPRLRRLIWQDTTERAILDALEGESESLALVADEGEIVLRSPLLTKTGVVNKTWDGGPIMLARAKGVNFSARDVRLTISLQVQSAVVQNYLRKRDNMPRSAGFFARFLVVWPPSTQGKRFTNGIEPTWGSTEKFHATLERMLSHQATDQTPNTVEQIVYEFDDDAKMAWNQFVNQVELNIRPGQYLDDIHDFAAKAGEIAARIAALFHHFSEQQGKISVDTLQQAITVVNFHIGEFKRIFSPQYTIPQVQLDFQSILHYLHRVCWMKGWIIIARNNVLRNGPVRDKARFNNALEMLVYQKAIWIGIDEKKKRFINLITDYFNSVQVL
jgi:hypothetical protein